MLEVLEGQALSGQAFALLARRQALARLVGQTLARKGDARRTGTGFGAGIRAVAVTAVTTGLGQALRLLGQALVSGQALARLALARLEGQTLARKAMQRPQGAD